MVARGDSAHFTLERSQLAAVAERVATLDPRTVPDARGAVPQPLAAFRGRWHSPQGRARRQAQRPQPDRGGAFAHRPRLDQRAARRRRRQPMELPRTRERPDVRPLRRIGRGQLSRLHGRALLVGPGRSAAGRCQGVGRARRARAGRGVPSQPRQPAGGSRRSGGAAAPTGGRAARASAGVHRARPAGSSVRCADAPSPCARAAPPPPQTLGHAPPGRCGARARCAARYAERHLAERPVAGRHADRRRVAAPGGGRRRDRCRLGAVSQALSVVGVFTARALSVGWRAGARSRRADRPARIPQWRLAARCRCDRAARCELRAASGQAGRHLDHRVARADREPARRACTAGANLAPCRRRGVSVGVVCSKAAPGPPVARSRPSGARAACRRWWWPATARYSEHAPPRAASTRSMP